MSALWLALFLACGSDAGDGHGTDGTPNAPAPVHDVAADGHGATAGHRVEDGVDGEFGGGADTATGPVDLHADEVDIPTRAGEDAPSPDGADPDPADTHPAVTHPADTHAPPIEAPGPGPRDTATSPLAEPQPTTTADPGPTFERPVLPLRAARSVLIRLVVGLAFLVAIQRLALRLRRRFPRLQDDLLLGQFVLMALVLVTTTMLVMRRLQDVSTTLVSWTLIAIGVGVMLLLVRALPRYLEGLWLMLGPAVRVGDHLTVGEVSGTLSEVGLMRMTLRRHDGRRFSVPVSALGGESLSILRRDHSQPLDLLLPAGPDPERTRQLARAAATLSPFRDPDTPVSVQVVGNTLEVAMVIWSPDVEEAALAHLRAAVGNPVGG